MNKGVLYGLGAYLLWGFYPIYWKALQAVPAAQILCHRVVWSFILLAALIVVRREFGAIKQASAPSTVRLIHLLSACLLGVNWLIYIWAVNAGFVVETSLGYFINPLVNVLFGVVFLRERLRPMQWLPFGLAGVGVLYLTISYGSLPWIALALAFSFGLYGLVKKVVPLGSFYGLTLETAILFIPALLFLILVDIRGSGAFARSGPAVNTLLALAGVVTVVPLLLFGAAVRRINLSLLGILQYLAPTCQFLIGVLVYHEPFTSVRMVGFSLIWAALLFYTLEGMVVRRRASLSVV